MKTIVDPTEGGAALTGNAGPLGAYGLQLPDLGQSSQLVVAPPSWPRWHFSWSSELPDRPFCWSPDVAEFGMLPVGRAHIDRRRGTTVLHLPTQFTDQALVHPYLATTAMAVALWDGLSSLHSGSFLYDGGVWAVLGSREAGKSSVLAWCHTEGIPIVADDLLITDGNEVRSGPRIIDLRPSAAERFELGTDAGVLGTRRRWRVQLAQVPAILPLRGWIELGWGADLAVDRIPVVDRMAVLLAHRGLQLPVKDDQGALLRLLALPAFRLTRPKQWSLHDQAMHRLLDRLSDHSRLPDY